MTDEPVEVSIEHELIPAPSKTRRAIPTTIQMKTFLFFSKNSLILSDAFSPVSYTHLDVYKRQV